jgi:DNA-binding HxlR family transcriptional regulator
MQNEDEFVDKALVPLHERAEQPALLKNLNKTHAVVYAEQGRKLREQLNETTLEIALGQRQSEADRGIPIMNWSFESAINDAVGVSALVKAEQARRAGRSKKTDTLQELILDIVRANQKITVAELLTRLRELDHKGIIEGVDTPEKPNPQIYFIDRNGHGDQAPISGLKDRLTRARKVIAKEIAQTR